MFKDKIKGQILNYLDLYSKKILLIGANKRGGALGAKPHKK